MAITSTPRFALKKYGSGSDPHPSRVEFNLMIDAIENGAALFAPAGARPAAGKAGRFFWDAAAGRMYYDDGTAWQDQNPNGGGGAGSAIAPGAAAAEGVSVKSARADHTHALALATAAVDGAMPKADKAKLDGATDAATASTVMRRDASARVSVGTPTLTGHATTKGYVDGQVTAIGTAAADYTDSAIVAAPAATGTAAGKMSAADKAKLDAATYLPTGSTLAMRSSSGSIHVVTGTLSADATSKGYVDTAITGAKSYADSAVSAAPAATGTAAGKMSAADKAKLDAAAEGSAVSTLVKRNSVGTSGFAYVNLDNAPTNVIHATRKDYVDAQVSGAKSYADDAVATAPAATTTIAGKMSAADKTKLNNATSAPTVSTVAMRSSAGRIQVADPGTEAAAATPKSYVDTAITGAKSYADSAVSAIPLVTSSTDGLLPKADKVKLDGATSAPTINTLALRNSAGRIQVAEPGTDTTAATPRSYVDGKVWDGSQITTGTISDARIANATAALDGLMPKADKAKLDGATGGATGSTLALRYADGRLGVSTPTGSGDAANKSYVDSKVWDGSDITTGTISPSRIANATSLTDGLMSKGDKAKLEGASVTTVDDSLVKRSPSGNIYGTNFFIDGTQGTAGNNATRKDYVDGQLAAAEAVFASFTPVWAGFTSTGTTGKIIGGQYAKIGPRLVRADMRLKAGTGASLGNGRVSVTLPFVADGAIFQFGQGALLPTGPTGPVRKVELLVAPGSDVAEIWSTPVPTEGLKTPGDAGYPFAKDSEIHVSITFQTVA